MHGWNLYLIFYASSFSCISKFTQVTFMHVIYHKHLISCIPLFIPFLSYACHFLIISCFVLLILYQCHHIFQVERRVVNQIAAAHEKDLIKPGCTLKITADYKVVNPDNASSDSLDSPMVKIQLIEEGKTKDLILGEVYQPDLPLFL